DPAESFPPQLRFAKHKDGSVFEIEPLAADIRAPTERKTLRKLRDEVLRLIAAMTDVGYGDLRRQRRIRSQRFNILLLAISLLLLIPIFAAAAWRLGYQAGMTGRVQPGPVTTMEQDWRILPYIKQAFFYIADLVAKTIPAATGPIVAAVIAANRISKVNKRMKEQDEKTV
ncbi:MAG: hypothetical protein LBV27_02625, partial [Oscillospiraceae bacterium]|nr:hypothetical protein [Oscillospiraceae bacterium]